MRIVSGFFLREIVGENVAIPSGDAARRLSGLVALNGSGKYLFELLQSEQTEDSLIQAMMDRYDVDEATAKADVAEFIALLRENKLLAEDS